MTWNELKKALVKQGVKYYQADNIIGHLMDDYKSWDWDAIIPDEVKAVLKH